MAEHVRSSLALNVITTSAKTQRHAIVLWGMNIIFRVLFVCLALQRCVVASAQCRVVASVSDTTLASGNSQALLLTARGQFSTTSLVKGCLQFNGVLPGDYKLKISTGDTDTLLAFVVAPGDTLIDLGRIRPVAVKSLHEVGVLARQPIAESGGDGTQYKVENTLLGASATVKELLSKVPGVSITGNRLNVFGRGEALVYVNGIQVPYERALSLVVANIKSVEVITEPPASYNAAGRAVVNLVLKKKETLTGVTLVQNGSFGRHYLNDNALNITAGEKLMLNAGGNLNLGKDWNTNTYSTFVRTASGTFSTNSFYQEDSKSVLVSSYFAGLQYTLNKRSDISVQYDGIYNLFSLDVQSRGDTKAPVGSGTFIDMRNNASTTTFNHSGNINYNLELDTLGSALFAGLQASYFRNWLYDRISERILRDPEQEIRAQRINDNHNSIALYTAQLDYKKVWPNTTRLECGWRYARALNAGDAKIRSRYEGSSEWTDLSQYANGSVYREDVPAIYGQLSSGYKKWKYSGGLRMEYTDVNGFSRRLNRNVIDSTYLNIFPSGSLRYTINARWATALTFSSRINRPVYQDLDPFVWYLDSLTSIQGNPALRPERAKSGEFKLSYRAYTFRLGYSQTQGIIRAYSRPGDTGVNSMVFAKDNLQQYRQLNVTVDVPLEVKRYSAYTSVALNVNRLLDARPEFTFRPLVPTLYIYTYHQFTFGKSGSIDVTSEYYSRACDGINYRLPAFNFSFGASYKFFSDRLSVQVLVNDAFRTLVWRGNREIGSIRSDFRQRFNTHYFRLGITARLGSLKELGIKNKQVNEKEFSRIKR